MKEGKEKEYQLCQLCKAVFWVESLKPIKVIGVGSMNVCWQCVSLADSRSKLPKNK